MAQLSNQQTQSSLADQIDEFMPKVVDTLGSSNLESVEAVEAEAEVLLRLAEKEAEAHAKSTIDPNASLAELTEDLKKVKLAILRVDRLQRVWEQLASKATDLWSRSFQAGELHGRVHSIGLTALTCCDRSNPTVQEKL